MIRMTALLLTLKAIAMSLYHINSKPTYNPNPNSNAKPNKNRVKR